MKAEETVMSNDVYSKWLEENPLPIHAMLKAQAEISFRAGIKEVVEWVINHYDNGIFLDEFKAQVKVWGGE